MDNSQYLKDLAAEEKRIKQVELDQQRAQALTQLEQEKAKVMPTFQQQRQQANVQSQIGAKNFAEYWANRGQTNAGINAQEQMSRANTLGNTMGGINQAQNQATLDFSNQALNTNTQFSNALQNSNATIDQNLNTNLYNERQRVKDAQAEERRFQQQQAATRAAQAEDARRWELEFDLKKDAATGKKAVKIGINPYVGKAHKDTLDPKGKFDPSKVFSNGYQPKAIGEKDNTLSKVKSAQPLIVNGQTQNVWKGAVDGRYYFWDGKTNQYWELTNQEKKDLGIK